MCGGSVRTNPLVIRAMQQLRDVTIGVFCFTVGERFLYSPNEYLNKVVDSPYAVHSPSVDAPQTCISAVMNLVESKQC